MADLDDDGDLPESSCFYVEWAGAPRPLTWKCWSHHVAGRPMAFWELRRVIDDNNNVKVKLTDVLRQEKLKWEGVFHQV